VACCACGGGSTGQCELPKVAHAATCSSMFISATGVCSPTCVAPFVRYGNDLLCDKGAVSGSFECLVSECSASPPAAVSGTMACPPLPVKSNTSGLRARSNGEVAGSGSGSHGRD
jgi:hypothetical protein